MDWTRHGADEAIEHPRLGRIEPLFVDAAKAAVKGKSLRWRWLDSRGRDRGTFLTQIAARIHALRHGGIG